jgi:preprotein translocase subunit Sec63
MSLVTRLSFKTIFTFLVICLAGLAYAGDRDFYKILGVKRNADAAKIKKGYRKMTMKYHPDKNQGDEKARQMF